MKLVPGGSTKKVGKVIVCTPTLDGDISIEYMVSMLETVQACTQAGIDLSVAYIRGDCFIAKARNNLITQFLEANGDQLFFIDADQGWSPQAFLKMVRADQEFVAAAVPKKCEEVVFNNADLVLDDLGKLTVSGDLIKIRTIGTGFIRLKRSVIDKMIKAHPETYVPGDGSPHAFHHHLFETKIISGQFWGEDLVFCKKWESIGGEIWLDPDVNMKHVGRKVWEGNYLSFLNANNDQRLAAKAA